LVRIGYWHFAFLGQESQWSAEASECAADQNAFWEYHDFLFENLGEENRGAFNQENLKRFADELGLDTEAFNQCLDSGRHSQIVQQETATGQQIGIRSTPSFLVNGQPVIGAQPFEAFQQVIEDQLTAINP
jgi:protein-disulfide isomerase